MKTRLCFLLALGFINLHSFAQDNPLFRHVPPDATNVFQINVPVLASKLPWEELMKMPMKPNGANQQKMMDMIKNPFATGVNITKDFFIAETDHADKGNDTIITVLFHLTDSAKFVAFLSKQEQGIRFFNLPNGRAAGKGKFGVAWDNELAVVTMIKPGGESKSAAPGGNRPAPNHAMAAARKSLAALKGFDASFYNTDATFKTGFSDNGDVHIWMPQGAGMGMLTKAMKNKAPMGGNQDFSKAMGMHHPNAHTLATVRFETGKATMKCLTIYPPDSIAFYSKLIGKPLNTDLVARLPKGKLLGMLSIHFNISGLIDILDKGHNRAKVDSMLASKGLTVDDITRAFQGDILLAGLIPDDSNAKGPSVYLVTTIGDMASFNKVAVKTKLIKDPAAPADDSTNIGMLDKMKIAYTSKDNILVLSTTKPNADAYFSNTDKRSTDFIPALVKDNPFSLLLDLKTVGNFVLSMSKSKDADKEKGVRDALDMLDTFIIAGGSIEDGKVASTFELKLGNPSDNSLKSLIKLIQTFPKDKDKAHSTSGE